MVDELVTKIAEETELDEDEARDKIDQKSEEFSGLVSEEGAAHLVAREHGVNLSKDADKELKIESVVPGMNRVNLKAQVVRITDPNTFTRENDDGEEEEGVVQNLILGDETGTLRMSLWDDQTELTEKVDEGDNIQISNAYSKEGYRNDAELRIGDSTKIKRIGDDEIDDVQQETSSSGGSNSYERATIDTIVDENANYEVQGEVVQVYTNSPFYRVCPECETSLKEDDDYDCPDHGDVDAEYRLVLSTILDDGFGNIRCLFFRDQAKKLLEAEGEDFNGNTQKVEEHAEKIQGKRIIVRGRSQENDFFDAMEILVNEMETPSIEQQIDAKIEAIQDE